MEQHQKIGQLDSPFLISNIGLDKKVRYLTISKHHILEGRILVEFNELNQNSSLDDRLWNVVPTKKLNYFNIKHRKSSNGLNKDLYLTLVQKKGKL